MGAEMRDGRGLLLLSSARRRRPYIYWARALGNAAFLKSLFLFFFAILFTPPDRRQDSGLCVVVGGSWPWGWMVGGGTCSCGPSVVSPPSLGVCRGPSKHEAMLAVASANFGT